MTKHAAIARRLAAITLLLSAPLFAAGAGSAFACRGAWHVFELNEVPARATR